MTHILIIDNSMDTTGAFSAILSSAIELAQFHSLEFTFILPSGSKCVELVEENNYPVFELPMLEISRRYKDCILYAPVLILNAFKTRKIIKSQRIDIVHVNDMYNLLGLAAKLITSIRVITHIRRMPESFPKWLYRVWSVLHIYYADKVIAVSLANKDSFNGNNDKIEVIYDPLPDNEKHNRYTPRDIINENVKIIYLANYTRGKGQQYSIELLRMFMDEFSDWDARLDIYGSDFNIDKNVEYKQELEDLVLKYALNAYVVFHDKCIDPEECLKNHDISLNLSDSESFSRLTLESLYYGIPVVATDVGGTKEMFCVECYQSLCKRGDINDMYRAFRSLLLKNNYRCDCSLSGYNNTRNKFNSSKSNLKLLDAYTAALK